MSSTRARIAVFLSGRGSGFQSLFKATEAGKLDADIVLVVSNKHDAGGIKLAIGYGLETFIFDKNSYSSAKEAGQSLLEKLQSVNAEYIALAGYLKLLPKRVVSAFSGRITNIHPALLPKYGGKGMYGHHVHEAVLEAGDKESGATVHLVDEIYDHGTILEQVRVPVMPDDSPETLAARVLIEEHKLYPRVLQKLIHGEYEDERD